LGLSCGAETETSPNSGSGGAPGGSGGSGIGGQLAGTGGGGGLPVVGGAGGIGNADASGPVDSGADAAVLPPFDASGATIQDLCNRSCTVAKLQCPRLDQDLCVRDCVTFTSVAPACEAAARTRWECAAAMPSSAWSCWGQFTALQPDQCVPQATAFQQCVLSALAPSSGSIAELCLLKCVKMHVQCPGVFLENCAGGCVSGDSLPRCLSQALAAERCYASQPSSDFICDSTHWASLPPGVCKTETDAFYACILNK
ncbi:MAG TPA: hypothetical protein VGJ84_00830, partial [Polyangiaceae bacterium]